MELAATHHGRLGVGSRRPWAQQGCGSGGTPEEGGAVTVIGGRCGGGAHEGRLAAPWRRGELQPRRRGGGGSTGGREEEAGERRRD